MHTGISFGDLAMKTKLKKMENHFLFKVEKLLDWKRIGKILNRIPRKRDNVAGCIPYRRSTMFKVYLLMMWYNLSEVKCAERLMYDLLFMKFCGFSMDDDTPDHSTISRFKNLLIQRNLLEKLLNEVNYQFAKLGINLKTGAVVDATLVSSAARPKKQVTIETEPVADAESEEQEFVSTEVNIQESKDPDAKWVSKRGRFVYGYKGNISVAPQYGLVQEIITTPANQHDTKVFPDLLQKMNLPLNKPVYADKGYCSRKNREILKEKELKSAIMFKNKKNDSEEIRNLKKRYNKMVSKTRYIVERTFGTLHKSYGYGRSRYFGLEKTHFFLQLGALAFNLKRAVKLCEAQLI